jgi:hypothetical protein
MRQSNSTRPDHRLLVTAEQGIAFNGTAGLFRCGLVAGSSSCSWCSPGTYSGPTGWVESPVSACTLPCVCISGSCNRKTAMTKVGNCEICWPLVKRVGWNGLVSCLCVCVCLLVCLCVCGRESDRERESARQR